MPIEGPPRFEVLPARTFVGLCRPMTFADHRPAELWRAFAPRIPGIRGRIGTARYSMARYGPGFFDAFDPHRTFEKWAAVETMDVAGRTEGLSVLTVSGRYAVFLHRGPASEGPRTFAWIFGSWLPASELVLDERPHFEVMGPAYRADAVDAEEELWIPVRDQGRKPQD